jgi:hypothetical protein
MPETDDPAEVLSGIYSEPAEFTAAIWLEHAPRYVIAVRDVLERDAVKPHDPNRTPRDNWSRVPWRQWEDAHAASSRVILPAGHPARYHSAGTGFFEIEAPGQGGRWQFYSAQLATASGHGDPQAVMRLATTAERTALLLELGTWTTDIGRVIHLDRDNGLWAEPYQPPARVRVTAAIVRDILLGAGLTEHQPGTEGFRITEQPDGRIRVEPAPAAGQPTAGPDAERSRLEGLRGHYRQALDRSCVVQEVDGLAYVLAPESRPQPRTA